VVAAESGCSLAKDERAEDDSGVRDRRPAQPRCLGHGMALVVVGAVACGPSLTTVHEGTIRFEHCYRLDLEPNETKPERRGCWQLWLGSYTYGQPRDRIEHARRRLRSLANGDSTRPQLQIAGEHNPEERQFYLVVPGPTNAHAPPPPIATVEKPPEGVTPKPTDKPPAAGCADGCQSSWEACCTPDAGAGCEGCKKDYTACMRGCFK
jgi:hypothetical protein